MTDLERPTTPMSLRITGIVGLVVIAWLLFGSALSVVGAAVALFGYLVVGVAAFMAGRFVGRHQNEWD